MFPQKNVEPAYGKPHTIYFHQMFNTMDGFTTRPPNFANNTTCDQICIGFNKRNTTIYLISWSQTKPHLIHQTQFFQICNTTYNVFALCVHDMLMRNPHVISPSNVIVHGYNKNAFVYLFPNK